jgi:hypothetical protein
MKLGPASAVGQTRVAGIIFRAHLIQQKAYTLNVTTQSQGTLSATNALLIINDPTKTPGVLFSQSDSALNNLDSPLTLTLIVLQDRISAYINATPLPTATDATYRGGQLGIYAASDPGITFESVFQNAKLWIF